MKKAVVPLIVLVIFLYPTHLFKPVAFKPHRLKSGLTGYDIGQITQPSVGTFEVYGDAPENPSNILQVQNKSTLVNYNASGHTYYSGVNLNVTLTVYYNTNGFAWFSYNGHLDDHDP